jgi:uncharacterized protein involved in exopolysaccharide biosynthesis
VGSEASKTAQYNALKREVDTQHQMYQTLLVQQSEANLSSSVPVNPIRIVEPAARARRALQAQAGAEYFLRNLFGLVLAGGIVFLKRADGSQH